MENENTEIVITKRKKNLMEKAKEAFIVEDFSIVWQEVRTNVIIPGVKRLIESGLHAIINGIFSGTVSDKPITYDGRSNDSRLISYDEYYGRGKSSSPARNDYREREKARKDISEYTFRTQEDAYMTLEWMNKVIRTSREGYITVAEWYDHFHIKAVWTDNDWCWRDLSSAKVMPNIDGGFYLLVPRPEPTRD